MDIDSCLVMIESKLNLTNVDSGKIKKSHYRGTGFDDLDGEHGATKKALSKKIGLQNMNS